MRNLKATEQKAEAEHEKDERRRGWEHPCTPDFLFVKFTSTHLSGGLWGTYNENHSREQSTESAQMLGANRKNLGFMRHCKNWTYDSEIKDLEINGCYIL